MVFKEIDKIKVKGKDEAITIYEPIGLETHVERKVLDELKLWQQTLRQYRSRQWDQAEVGLLNLQRVNPDCAESNLPLTIGMMIDASGSQRNVIDMEKEVGGAFLKQVLTDKDEAYSGFSIGGRRRSRRNQCRNRRMEARTPDCLAALLGLACTKPWSTVRNRRYSRLSGR